VKSIRESGRSTQGVTLINLGEGEKLSGIERIDEPDLPETDPAVGDQAELI
jgi:DNA gyrase subunit A